jgi:hypothetical protein
MLVLFNLWLSDEPRFDLFAKTIRVALDADRRGVIENPVQDGCCDHLIPEDLIPLAEGPVGGLDQGSFFVTPGDELEEEMRAVAVDWDVFNLVDDEELGPGFSQMTSGRRLRLMKRSRWAVSSSTTSPPSGSITCPTAE